MMDVQDGIGKLVNGLGRVRECGRADKERGGSSPLLNCFV